MELSGNVKISQGITTTAGAAGTSVINANVVDMQGWDGVVAIVSLGAIVSGAVTSLKFQQGNSSSGPTNLADAADLAGTGQTIADTDDDTTRYVFLDKPTERYVRLVVSRATQNATIGNITYVQYGPKTAPLSAHGTSVSGEAHISPAEGTA